MLHRVVALVLSLLAAAAFIHVGRLFLHRSARGTAHRVGLVAFATWWFGVAAHALTGIASRSFHLFGGEEVFVYRALTWISLIPLTLALGGLVAYLLYLSTGNVRVVRGVAVGYGVLYLLFVLLLAYLHPVGVEVVGGEPRTVYENSLPRPLAVLVLLGILAPAILSVVAYGRLFFRLHDPTSRYRIGLVASGLLVWFVTTLTVSTAGLSANPWWSIVSPLIQIFAALLVLAAYRPPAWVQRRFGVEALASSKKGGGGVEGTWR